MRAVLAQLNRKEPSNENAADIGRDRAGDRLRFRPGKGANDGDRRPGATRIKEFGHHNLSGREQRPLTFAYVDLNNEFNFGLSTASANLKPNRVFLCDNTVLSDTISVSITAAGRVSLTFYSAPSETPKPCPPTGNVIKFEGKCPGGVCDVSSFFKINPSKGVPVVKIKSLYGAMVRSGQNPCEGRSCGRPA
jgi:hypothetical protein